MATQLAINGALPIRTAKQTDVHPLSPVSAEEIQSAVELIRSQWPVNTDLHFKTVTLQEPAKAETLPYLDAEAQRGDLPRIDRKAFLTYYLRKTVRLHQSSGLLCLHEADCISRTSSMRQWRICQSRQWNTTSAWGQTRMLLVMELKSSKWSGSRWRMRGCRKRSRS